MGDLSWAEEQSRLLARNWGESMRIMAEQLGGGDRMKDWYGPNTAPEPDESVDDAATEDDAEQ